MKRLFILLLLASGGASAQPADSIRLGDLYEAAREHFPLQSQRTAHQEIARMRMRTIAARYLPSLSMGGQAMYQSDVPELPVELPGAPEVSRDQYKAAVNVEQLIYDGGAGAVRRQIEQRKAEAAIRRVEVEFHERLERINEAFFAALLQESAAARLESLRSDIDARRQSLRAVVAEGIGQPSNVDKLSVELLHIEQQLVEASERREAAIAALRALTGWDVSAAAVLVTPSAHGVEDVRGDVGALRPPRAQADREAIRRPEREVFDATRDRLEAQHRLARLRTVPTISSFASAAYGRPPGMNIFENELSPFYSLGIQVRWPLWDWGSSRRERQALDVQRGVVDRREKAFLQGIEAAAESARHDIQRIRRIMLADEEVIALRARIAERAVRQLDEGTISATDYLLVRHAEHQARLAHERRGIELAYAQVRYLTILGRTDEIR